MDDGIRLEFSLSAFMEMLVVFTNSAEVPLGRVESGIMESCAPSLNSGGT